MSKPPPGRAVITGASSGIGEAFARRLAAAGHDLILVARREGRLRALVGELEKAHGVQAEAMTADLAVEAEIIRLEEHLRALPDLALLINNAGFGSGGLYHLTDAARQFDMIRVHVLAAARLTRAVLPGLVERGRGAIINVASIAAFAVVPTSAMYGSTKSWMVHFTRSLAEELRGTGVRAQALCPGFTYTGFHDTPAYQDFDRSVVPRFLWMSADEVASCSLEALARDRVMCIPGAWNKLMVALLRFPPAAALARYYGRRRWRK